MGENTYGADSSGEERDRTRLLVRRSGSFCSAVSFWRHDAVNNGDINSSLLPNGPVLENPADAATAAGPGPNVIFEVGPAIGSLKGGADGVLTEEEEEEEWQRSFQLPGRRETRNIPVTLMLISDPRNFSVRAPIAAPFAATRSPRRTLHFYRNNFIGSN
ncbi:uncharacterized protein DS421_12g378990 [Arachis hypogaea]|nr:uncharacterized protein DS421_12g378990 [Arachis hypogaea]